MVAFGSGFENAQSQTATVIQRTLSAVILPQIQIARAHWILGALFLAIILDEYLPLVGSPGRAVRSRSPLVPCALIIGAVGVWATVVFADVVHDMLVHFLWGDIVRKAGIKPQQ